MFECFINLYAFNFEYHTNTIKVITLNKEKFIPLSLSLSKDYTNIDNVLKEIIADHLICNISDIKPRLFDVSILNEVINLNFIATTPVDLKLSQCYYMLIENNLLMTNEILKKAMVYV